METKTRAKSKHINGSIKTDKTIQIHKFIKRRISQNIHNQCPAYVRKVYLNGVDYFRLIEREKQSFVLSH